MFVVITGSELLALSVTSLMDAIEIRPGTDAHPGPRLVWASEESDTCSTASAVGTCKASLRLLSDCTKTLTLCPPFPEARPQALNFHSSSFTLVMFSSGSQV